jgi:hypothetical protein
MRFAPKRPFAEEAWGLRVSRQELAILRSAITQVARHDRHAWKQLKWEIWEYGYRDHYSAEELFNDAAERALRSLNAADKETLNQLWRDSHPNRAADNDGRIINAYSRLIVEKVIERARTAGNRTIHW